MKISPVCEQKGLRIYIASKNEADDRVRYKATLVNGGCSLDVPVIKARNSGCIFVEIPAKGTEANSRVEITERHTGGLVADIDVSHAEFLSKISRRVPEEFSLLGAIEEIDLQSPLHRRQYDLNLDDCFDALDGDVVWRIAVDWRGSDKSKPRLELVGNDLKRLDVEIHEFEFQKGLLREGHEVSRMIATFRTPRHLTDFCLFARDPQREVTSNFYPMDSIAADSVLLDRAERTKSIDEQQDVYPRWLDAKMRELQTLEAELVSVAKDALHIIVFAEDAPTHLIEQTLASLKYQLFENWEATVLSPIASQFRDSDRRISFSQLPDKDQTANEASRIAEESGAARICMVEAGDVFARGALAAIANASNDPLSIVVFDEDSVDEHGIHSRPKLKGALNKQLEYSENWIGYGAFFPAELVSSISFKNVQSPLLIAYALSLKAIERGLPFEAVPYVLLHAFSPPEKSETTIDAFPASDAETAKKILSGHLRSIGARSIVEDGFLEGTLKISLTEDRAGKVSVVIPTMDHADMLERCVSSLLNKTTYKDIEIVLVENNSKMDETFALYDRLKKENPDVVKVVEWDGPFNYPAIINHGVAASTGEYLLLLNNDTEVIVPRFIEEMLALTSIPEVGVVGAKLYFKDMLVQHAGMVIGPYGGISHANQNFSDTRPGYQNRALTQCSFSSVTGACQMVRRKVFDEVGGYDETFAVGFNDADFCLKVRAAGYDVVFTPYAELYHYEFVSRGREGIDSEKQARWERERDAFFEKWHSELENGDPLVSPNLDKDNWYYALPDIQTT